MEDLIKPLLESPCCVAHTFQAIAALHPRKLAIVHASPRVTLHRNRGSMHPSAQAPEGVRGIGASDLVNFGDVSYTFEELHGAVESLARRLRLVFDKGKDGAASVGIWMAQSVEYLASVLAVLTVGGVFIPMDPSWPVGRLQNALRSANPAILLGCRHTSWSPQNSIQAKIAVLEAADGQLWWLPEGFVNNETTGNAYEDDRGCASKEGRSFSYILYTSGSSGTPKGVCGTEEGLMNRLSWMESAYPHVNADVGCFKTSVGFVDHLTEALAPLLAGNPLVIPSPEILKGNLLALLDYIEAYKITRLTAVPSIFRALLPALQSNRRHAADSLRILSLSGESLSLKLLEELHSVFTHTTILNLYGSTEVSGDSSCFDCTRLWDPSSTRMQILELQKLSSSTPIGGPIRGCSHSIVVDGNKVADVNEEGELWVGGVGVAASYLNDPDSTFQRFIDLSSIDKKTDCIPLLRQLKEIMQCGERVFKTGDVAKRLPDGTVVVLGRTDRQVKIRGNRIALEEIEANMEMHPEVSRCVVTVRTRLNGETDLVAYVVCNTTSSLLRNDIRTKAEEGFSYLSREFKVWLEGRLPSVMIPQIYIPLEAVPLNDSGKVDISALPDSTSADCNRPTDPGLPGIDHIRQVFAHVLKAEKLSNTDDFFSRGGTSISAAHVAHLLDIDMRLMYLYPSATLLYDAIQGRFSESIPGDPVTLNPPSVFSGTESVTGMTEVAHLVHPKPEAVDGHRSSATSCASQEQSLLLSRKRQQHGETGVFVSRKAMKGQRWAWNDSTHSTGVSLGFSRCNRTVRLHSLPEDLQSIVMERNVLVVRGGVAGEARRIIQPCWKVSLQACVDASPLVVLHGEVQRVFIGSHSHRILSLDATSGELQWEAALGGRVESSAAVTRDVSQVVVGCYDGFIYFLDFENGQKLWSFKTAGEVKCQPALDPWTGLIWNRKVAGTISVPTFTDILATETLNLRCGSHDHHIYALDSISHTCIWRHDCGGSIFGSPAFNESSKTVYVGTTRGTIIAIQIQPTIHVQWSYECGAPIFGSLAVDSSTDYVICTSVSGVVTALQSAGIPVWQAKTNGPIFAGATISSALVSQVLVSSGDSHLYCLNLQDGALVWKQNVGGPITSSAYVEENPVLLQQDCNNDRHVAERRVCVTSTCGMVHVLCAPTAIMSRGSLQSPPLSSWDNEMFLQEKCGLEIEGVQHMKLPGEVFSSPVMISGRIFVGCRDNFLYCLELV